MAAKKRILTLVSDLMFSSLIREMGQRLGYLVENAADFTAFGEQLAASKPDLVMVDLHAEGLEGMNLGQAVRQARGVPIIAFGRHTEPALLRAARRAGCAKVLPRSTFVQQLPSLILELTGKNEGPVASSR